MVWKGPEAAGNQCEQSCEEAWKIRENPNTKREERIRRKSKRSKKIGNRSKWEGWPKEKELLDKGDGLATAAGARRNDEVTTSSQNISTYIQVHEGSLVRLTVVFRRS